MTKKLILIAIMSIVALCSCTIENVAPETEPPTIDEQVLEAVHASGPGTESAPDDIWLKAIASSCDALASGLTMEDIATIILDTFPPEQRAMVASGVGAGISVLCPEHT